MTERSGFFNSTGGDRVYSASDINDFFKGFVTEGVLSPVGGYFAVTAPGGGMNVNVADGKAWFLNTWLTNSQNKIVSLAAGDVTNPRKDLIILDFDLDNRINTIQVLQGTPAATPAWPALADNSRHKQVPICVITVGQGVTEIDAGDLENLIGSSYCPFCTGLLQQATIDGLNGQWENEFQNWMLSIEADLQEIDTTGTLAELEDIRNKPIPGRNMIINGDMKINQRTYDEHLNYTYATASLYPFPLCVDHWIVDVFSGSSSAVIDVTREENGYLRQGECTLKFVVKTPQASLGTTGGMMIKQFIESSRCGQIKKGTPDAQPMIATFRAKTNLGGKCVLEIVDKDNSRSVSRTIQMIGDANWHSYSANIPADLTGQLFDDDEPGLEFNLWFAAGSGYDNIPPNSNWHALEAGQRAPECSNWLATTNNYVELTDVQLEVGTVYTGFDRRSLAEELRLCQRYMEFYPVLYGMAIGTSNTGGWNVAYSTGWRMAERKCRVPNIKYTSAHLSYVASIFGDTTWPNCDLDLWKEYDEQQKHTPWFRFQPQAPPPFYLKDDWPYFTKIVNLEINAEFW